MDREYDLRFVSEYGEFPGPFNDDSLHCIRAFEWMTRYEMWIKQQNIIDKLREDNTLMRECLGLYGDKSNWIDFAKTGNHQFFQPEKSDTEIGGINARDCLDKLKKDK